MQRAYETTVIVDALLSDEKIDKTIKSTEEFLKSNATVKNVDRRGKRRLAYEVKKKTHGDYTTFTYESKGDAIAELERKLRLDESVVRYLTVLKEDAAKE